MQMKKVAVLVLSGILLSLVLYPRSLAEPPVPPAAGDPTVITMHFKGEKLTTADPAAGNSTEEKATAAGRPWGARFSGTIIGEWAFLPTGNFQVQGAFKAVIWGQSTAGAKNAGFRLNFYVGSTLVRDLYTERADVSSPHKFSISDSVTTNVRAGVTVKVGLVWLSDPNFVVGPSGGGDFMYGSKDHDSNIMMTLAGVPVTMNVTGYDREGGAVRINARINESLGMDPNDLGYELMMTGPATILPGHIGKALVVAGENGTMVSWMWNNKLSRAGSGLYTLTLTVAYCNDTKISNATTLSITFPAPAKDDGLANLVKGNNLYLMVGIIVIGAIAGGGGGLMYLKRRKRRRARMRAEREMAMADAA
jgi:hypothetical protein